MDTTLEFTDCFPAVRASVPMARRALANFARRAGASDEQLESIRLASSEALTNVVLHAYGDRQGSIDVVSAVTGDEMWVLIGDDGGGFQALSDGRGLGIGLALIAAVADTFSVVKRSSGGTEVQMRFGLHARNEPERDQRRGSLASAKAPA